MRERRRLARRPGDDNAVAAGVQQRQCEPLRLGVVHLPFVIEGRNHRSEQTTYLHGGPPSAALAVLAWGNDSTRAAGGHETIRRPAASAPSLWRLASETGPLGQQFGYKPV